jgi:hypothetical protein
MPTALTIKMLTFLTRTWSPTSSPGQEGLLQAGQEEPGQEMAEAEWQTGETEETGMVATLRGR